MTYVHPSYSTMVVKITNLSSNMSVTQIEPAFEIANIIVSIIVLLFGVIENTCVLVILGSRWKQLKSFEIHIISLAIADLIESTVFPAKELFLHLGGKFEHLGVATCKLISFVSSISISVSALTIIAISIDRYVGIKWPLHRYFTKQKSLYIASCIWMFSVSIAIIFLIDGRVVLCRYRDISLCGITYMSVKEEQIMVVAYFIVQGGIPLIALIVIYSLIIRELSYDSRKTTIFKNNEKERQARFLQNRRTTKLVFGIVIVFIICVIPDRVFFLLYIFDNQFMPNATFKRIHVILLMLFMANGCVNPIIYSRIHSLFRRQFLGSIEKIRTISWWPLRKHFRYLNSWTKSTKTESIEDDEFTLMHRRCSQLRYTHFDDEILQERTRLQSLTQSKNLIFVENIEEIVHYSNNSQF